MRRKRESSISVPWPAFMDAVIAVIPMMIIITFVFVTLQQFLQTERKYLDHYFLLEDSLDESEFIMRVNRQDDNIYLLENIKGILFENALTDLKRDIDRHSSNEIILEIIYGMDEEYDIDAHSLLTKILSLKAILSSAIMHKEITYEIHKSAEYHPVMIKVREATEK